MNPALLIIAITMYLLPKRNGAQLIKNITDAQVGMMKTMLASSQVCNAVLMYPGNKPFQWYTVRCPIRGPHKMHTDENYAGQFSDEDIRFFEYHYRLCTETR